MLRTESSNKKEIVRILSQQILQNSHSKVKNKLKAALEEGADPLEYNLLFGLSQYQGYVFSPDTSESADLFDKMLHLSYGMHCKSVGTPSKPHVVVRYDTLFELLQFPEFSGLIHQMNQEELNDFFDVNCLTFKTCRLEFKKHSAQEGYIFNFFNLLPKQEELLKEFVKNKYGVALKKNNQGDLFLDCVEMNKLIYSSSYAEIVINEIVEDVQKKLSQLAAQSSITAAPSAASSNTRDEKLSDKSQVLFNKPKDANPIPQTIPSNSVVNNSNHK